MRCHTFTCVPACTAANPTDHQQGIKRSQSRWDDRAGRAADKAASNRRDAVDPVAGRVRDARPAPRVIARVGCPPAYRRSPARARCRESGHRRSSSQSVAQAWPGRPRPLRRRVANMLRRLGGFVVAQLDLVDHLGRHPTGGAILFQRPSELCLSANERLEQACTLHREAASSCRRLVAPARASRSRRDRRSPAAGRRGWLLRGAKAREALPLGRPRRAFLVYIPACPASPACPACRRTAPWPGPNASTTSATAQLAEPGSAP